MRPAQEVVHGPSGDGRYPAVYLTQETSHHFLMAPCPTLSTPKTISKEYQTPAPFPIVSPTAFDSPFLSEASHTVTLTLPTSLQPHYLHSLHFQSTQTTMRTLFFPFVESLLSLQLRPRVPSQPRRC